jgi:hypothetical protein
LALHANPPEVGVLEFAHARADDPGEERERAMIAA